MRAIDSGRRYSVARLDEEAAMAETVATRSSSALRGTDSPKTTGWAGAAIALGGTLTFLTVFGRRISDDVGAFLLATSPADIILAELLFLAATVILALGWPGERGVAGSSIVGKAALIAFGVFPLLNIVLLWQVLPAVPVGADAVWTLVGDLAGAAALLGLAAGVVAGVAVLRARVLHGFAGWALLVVAAWDVLFFALQTLPGMLLTPEARDLLIQSWNSAGFIWVAVAAAGPLLRLVWGGSYIFAVGRKQGC
jgi:hypothetical protein